MRWGIILFLILINTSLALAEQEVAIPTKEILERLIRLEEGQKSFQVQLDGLKKDVDGIKREVDGIRREVNEIRREVDGNRIEIEGIRREIDNLRNLMLTGFGIMFAGIFGLIAIVIWDRRTALTPAIREIEALRKRERDLEDVLRKYAYEEPKIAEIMKSLGMW